MIDPVLLLTITILAAIGIGSAALAYRHPLSFRIAFRNVRRARTRSVLVILGLLVGTAIISGSLSVGDTIQGVNVHYTYIGVGYTDEAVSALSPTAGYQYFPQSIADRLVTTSSSNPDIAGVCPEIVDVVQAFDRTTGIPQTNLNLVGSEENLSHALGSFTTVSGASLSGPAPGEVLLDALAAQSMNASAGDTVTLYGAVPVVATVQAVVQDDLRGGFLTAGLSGGTVFADLATAQVIENESGQVNFIAVTNVGSQVDGVAASSSVSAQLNATLSGLPGASQLAAHPILQERLADARAAGTSVATIFLVFGLFSIVAGAMLIVGIFTMLAEERKGEMGMLRAVGLTRRDVVLSYYFEGLIYSVGSAFAGTLVGVATGFTLLYVYVLLFANGSAGIGAVLSAFTITTTSLATAYLAGFLLTLATVAVASFRVSRLNIVRAIRDVPEPPPPIRTYTYLAYLGVACAALGALLFAATFRGSSDISYPMIGGGLMILGGALVASRFVTNRTAFSVAGALLLVWAGWEGLPNVVLGTGHTGGIFVIFVEGMELIGGAVLLFAFNGPALAAGIERLATGRIATAPVARLGLAYPSRRATRTSINTTIFALVLFTIVVLATYSATLTGNLNDSIAAQSGGYTFFGQSARPIPDLPGQIADNATLSPFYSNVVPLVSGTGFLRVPGFSSARFVDGVYAAPDGGPASSNFYDTNQFPFLSTLDGRGGAQIMSELSSNRSVAVVDGYYASGGGFMSTGAHPVLGVGTVVRLENPGTGAAANVTVIGILQEEVLNGVWLNPGTASSLGFNVTNGYLLTLHPGVSTTLASQKTKGAFYRFGLVLVAFTDVLATTIALISGDIGLLEVFIGLGLAVGIAAIGIVAHRSVTERRREIGMLRATGLTRGMVLRLFLVEYSFVTLFGAAIGGVVGLVLVYNLVISPGASSAGVSQLFVPWLNLLVVVVVTGVLSTLAVIGPSLRAARLPPAEAVRSQE